MFWEVNRNAREQDMRELSQLLAAFFSYAAAQGGTALDENALRRAFPKSAQRFLDQFQGKEENRSGLQKAVKDLFLLPPVHRQAIERAVSHDMDFDRAADPSHFYFMVPSLPEAERKIVKAFFKYFYDVTFHHAVGPGINGHVSQATRDRFCEDYYQANRTLRRVCPVCLHRKSNAPKESDLEHYFPKSVYFPLILHPSNLFFICKECNENYKRAKDALQKGTKPLSKVFLPYQDTVKEHAAVAFHRTANEDHVKLLSAAGAPDEQEKIDSFDHLYQLEERWSADIEGIFDQLRVFCTSQSSGEEKLPKEEVRRKLLEKCEELRALSAFPDRFVEAAYLNWLCGDMFDVFYDNL